MPADMAEAERSHPGPAFVTLSAEMVQALVDHARNDSLDGSDGDIGEEAAATRALVVRAREDLEIASEVRRLLSPPARSSP